MRNTIRAVAGMIAFLLLTGAVLSAAPAPPASSDLLKPLPPVSQGLVAALSDTGRTFLDMSAQPSGKHLSMQKAMFLSILMPGAGQYYAGAKLKGQVFMGIEAAIWSGFVALRVYGGWKKDDYQAYAATHAGVDNAGKDDQFYDWIGFYDSRDEFNQFGRLYYPDRMYLPDNQSNFWQWDSETSRVMFKELKDASRTSFRNSTFMLGLALVNRLISGIDTYRTVKAAGKRVDALTQFGAYRLKISPRFSEDNPGLHLAVSRKF